MKLQTFHQSHETPVNILLDETALLIEQFPINTRRREAEVVATMLEEQAKRRGASTIGELLPAVLARLGIDSTQENVQADRLTTATSSLPELPVDVILGEIEATHSGVESSELSVESNS